MIYVGKTEKKDRRYMHNNSSTAHIDCFSFRSRVRSGFENEKNHQLQGTGEMLHCIEVVKTKLVEKRAEVGMGKRAGAECNLSYLCMYRSLKVKTQVLKMII